jgi:hypothetical protein
VAPLVVRLWEWIDAACAAVLVAPSPVGGRLSAADRGDLRRWLEAAWHQDRAVTL